MSFTLFPFPSCALGESCGELRFIGDFLSRTSVPVWIHRITSSTRSVCVSVYMGLCGVSLCCVSLHGLRVAVCMSLWCLCVCVGGGVCVRLSVYVSGVCVYVYVCYCGICLCAGESLHKDLRATV